MIEEKLVAEALEAEPPPPYYEPLAVRIPVATRISGLSQTELYRYAGRGELIFRKNGSATLVDYPSLRRLVESLPVADIRTRT